MVGIVSFGDGGLTLLGENDEHDAGTEEGVYDALESGRRRVSRRLGIEGEENGTCLAIIPTDAASWTKFISKGLVMR
jgi:hypothetical protein